MGFRLKECIFEDLRLILMNSTTKLYQKQYVAMWTEFALWTEPEATSQLFNGII